MRLREHQITLRSERLTLRPMTEEDWELLLGWNSDPEVLYFSEGDDVSSRSLEDVQGIYREVSQKAFCFIVELAGRPIGECWLQEMNLERILVKYSEHDCRRIDLMIGEKELWGQGYGTEIIGVLTAFAFGVEKADAVFGCYVADYNPRSRRAFEKNGYRVDAKTEESPGRKARFSYDLVIHHSANRGRE